MGSISEFAAGTAFLFFAVVQIGIVTFILVAIWRGIKALESVAASLASINERGPKEAG